MPLARKRKQVSVACNQCRAHKAKCDGMRPTCARCQARSETCEYDVAADTTRSVALKRTYASLQTKHDHVQGLLECIRTRAPDEVAEIVRRIRTSNSAYDVLRLMQNGDIMFQQHVQSPLPDLIASRIDADALRESHLKVPSRPWTTVAGDGLVSDLIASFFDTEQPYFFPMLDPRAFTSDMLAADVSMARYCSPLLVNAICAVGAFTSQYALAVDAARGRSKLSSLFFDEAKKLLDREEGKASLSTTQALFLMYIYCIGTAKDRLGLMYRFFGCEMYKRMRSGERIPKDLLDSSTYDHKTPACRHAWGVFLFEIHISTSYLEPALLKTPTLPIDFADSDSPTPPPLRSTIIEPGRILTALYQGAAVFAKIASARANDEAAAGSPQDIKTRMALYNQLRNWAGSLPPKSCYPPEKVPEYHYLSACYQLYALLIFRPLRGLGVKLPSPVERAEDFCLATCIRILKELELWESAKPRLLERGSLTTLWFYSLVSFTLQLLLKSHDLSRRPFVSTCCKLRKYAEYWPTAFILLGGIKAVSLELGIEIPHEASSCFLEIDKKLPKAENGDIPITWALPQHSDLLELLSDDGMGSEQHSQSSIELGLVISKYTRMSL